MILTVDLPPHQPPKKVEGNAEIVNEHYGPGTEYRIRGIQTEGMWTTRDARPPEKSLYGRAACRLTIVTHRSGGVVLLRERFFQARPLPSPCVLSLLSQICYPLSIQNTPFDRNNFRSRETYESPHFPHHTGMNPFDRNPNSFRIVFGLLVCYVLALSAITIYRYGSSPTDENLFTTPPSNLLIMDEIRADPSGPDNNAILSGGAIPPYNLLVEVNDEETESLAQLHGVINDPSLPSTIEIRVHLLKEDEAHTYRIQTDELKAAKIKELPTTAFVVGIARDGASDRAGMKVGDLIYTINGQTFPNIFAADSILRSGQIGKGFSYDVLRDDHQLTLHVTLASFGIPFPMLVAIFSGLVFIAVGSFIGFKRPLIKAARLLGVLFLVQGYFLTNMFIRRDLSLGGFALFVNLTLIVCIAFTFPLYVHSALYFPQESVASIKNRWIVRIAYVIAILFCIATLLFDYVGFFSSLSVSIAYIIFASKTIYKTKSGEQAAMAKPLEWMGATAWTGASCFWVYLLIGGLGGFRYLGYMGIPLLLVPISYVYVIGRHRLLDLDLRIRRSAQYAIIATVWIAGLILLFFVVMRGLSQWNLDLPNIRLTGGSVEIIDEPMMQQDSENAQNILIIAGTLAISVGLWKAGKTGLQYIARRFHRSRYDYRRAATELSTVMSTQLNMKNLAQGIVQKLGELMSLKRVGVLFFRDQRDCCCEEAYGFDGSSWKEFCIRTGNTLTDAVQRFHGEFRVDYLPEHIKEEFRRHEFQYLIPIRSKETLVGTLLVGEKRSESPFEQEDLEFLSAVARQASVSIENAFLYEELAEQERMKHELAIARKIQLESLPQTTPQIDGLDIAGVSIPAMEVGGDYYDYLNGSMDRLTVVVGDVSGKGTSAALYMSKIQGIIRSLNAFGLSPRELFTRTNDLLWRDLEKKSFVTAIGAAFLLRDRQVILARAGHLPLFHYQAHARRVDRVIPKGIGMGLSGNGTFSNELEEIKLSLNSGDVFLFITDGITEGKDTTSEEFGEERLVQLLQNSAQLTAREICDTITAAVKDFTTSTPQHDDQTVVVVKAC